VTARQFNHVNDVLAIFGPFLTRVVAKCGVALGSPEHESGWLHLAACFEVSGVHWQIDVKGGSVVFADRMNILRRTDANVLINLSLREATFPRPLFQQLRADVVLLFAALKRFGKAIWLSHEPPVVKVHGHLCFDVLENAMCRQYI
jgi:hypothetical protein